MPQTQTDGRRETTQTQCSSLYQAALYKLPTITPQSKKENRQREALKPHLLSYRLAIYRRTMLHLLPERPSRCTGLACLKGKERVMATLLHVQALSRQLNSGSVKKKRAQLHRHVQGDQLYLHTQHNMYKVARMRLLPPACMTRLASTQPTRGSLWDRRHV